MHEVSIALGMVDELFRIAQDNNAKKITLIRLKIGKMSGIVSDSLQFAFDAIKAEHPLISSAEMVITEIPMGYHCNECRQRFETDESYFPSCPECGTGNIQLVSGEEQHIDQVEVEV